MVKYTTQSFPEKGHCEITILRPINVVDISMADNRGSYYNKIEHNINMGIISVYNIVERVVLYRYTDILYTYLIFYETV